MKALLAWGMCALGASLLAPAVAWAQTAPARAFTVLPPPPLNAPGAKAVAPRPSITDPGAPPAAVQIPASPGSVAPALPSTAIPIPALPSMRDEATQDGRGQPPPTVKVIKHKGQLIEEYYDGGQLYMVQVHPKHGVTYTYFVSKGHDLTRGPGAPPVSPVMYTILEWGKPDSK